jgi:hypothetical protein
MLSEWHEEGRFVGRLPARSTAEATIADEERKANLLAKFKDAVDFYYRDLYCLTHWLVRLAPEWSILDRALAQARIHFERLPECDLRSPQKRVEDALKCVAADLKQRRKVESLGAESMRDPRSLVSVPSSNAGAPTSKKTLELVTQQAEERHRIANDLRTGRLVLDRTLTPVLSAAAVKQQLDGKVGAGTVPTHHNEAAGNG